MELHWARAVTDVADIAPQGVRFACRCHTKGDFMSIRAFLVVVCAAAAVALGCQNRDALPASPSGATQANTISAGSLAQAAAKTAQGKTVTLMDACDPETFNAPPPLGIGPGTCVRQGGVRLENFLDQLGSHHSVGAWHMAPGEVMIKLGDVLSAF